MSYNQNLDIRSGDMTESTLNMAVDVTKQTIKNCVKREQACNDQQAIERGEIFVDILEDNLWLIENVVTFQTLKSP